MFKHFACIVVLLLGLGAFGLPAHATTAADENGSASITTGGQVGPMRSVFAGLLCSNIANADTGGNCTAMDFSNIPMGHSIVIMMHDDGEGYDCASGICTVGGDASDDCTATPTVTLSTADYANDTSTPNVPPASARAIATTTAVDDSSATARVITLNTEDTPLERYLFTSIATATNCDDVDVSIKVFERSH